MKGNVVTKLLVTLNFKFNVTDIPVTIPLHSTVPHRPTSGTLADRPTLGITYPLTDRPDGRPWASDRSASRGNTSGRRPIAWDRPDRTYTLKRTCTRQRPTERRDADRTGHHWDGARTHSHIADELPAARSMAYHRANAPTRPSAAPGRLRVPRARATQAAAGQAAAQHRLGRTHRHSSSRNRMRSPLQLLRRSLRQRPLRPREREVAFVLDHRISSTNISVGRNALTDERFNVS